MKSWLIRHPNLRFDRPVSESDLITLIETGKLGPKDEICKSGGYWFPLQDAQEVRKFLGNVKLEAILPKMSDRTSTSLVTDTRGKSVEGLRSEVNARNQQGPAPLEAKLEFAHADEAPAYPEGEADDPDQESSIGSRVFFGMILLFIFFGTLYLLWSGSR